MYHVPVDEPAVAAARADHLTAKGVVAHAAYANAVPAVHAAPAVHTAPAHYGLVAHPNGAVVPVDEPAVAAARAEHLTTKGAVAHAAYAAAPVAAVPAVAPVAAAPAAYAAAPAAYAAVPAVPVAPAHYGLVAHPNGAVVPADEPAVAAAKAQFAAAGGVINPVIAGLPYAYAGYPYAAGYAAAYGYPYGGLVAHANGAVVPVDEPAVAAARADHLAAKAAIY